jgi:trehalose 6-phosphate synthase/phosphatase
MNEKSNKGQRLVIIANRLPFTITRDDDNLNFTPSSGGLVSAMNSFQESWNGEILWVGWPGLTISEKEKKFVTQKAMEEYKSHPVFLQEKTMDKFYHGFCNKTLWPLFHYFPLLATYDEEQWNTYKTVNKAFLDACKSILRPDDILWIHDYHLMLFPKLLRDQMPGANIGFFLHIPFPSYEIFRLIPRDWGIEILEGMLGSDVIGFHTHDYTQYFLRNVLRILGHEHNLGQMILPNRIVKADTFPLGIDYNKFNKAHEIDDVKKERDELSRTLNVKKTIFSVDRLDYTKGIINRLHGYELFLEKNPSWHKNIVFILVVVPSRVSIEHYQNMKNRIDELVGKINGKYGCLTWNPIVYQFKSLTFPALSALYNLSDVALITPLRDGMNLVAKEYVASRTDDKGVIILSEFAGAAKEMGEAIIINPNHKEEIAKAILSAVEMPESEQRTRINLMQTRLQTYDVKRWAGDFLQTLSIIKEEQKKFELHFLSISVMKKINEAYSKAAKRLLLLDYDGTLVPFSRIPVMASPDEDLINIIKKLSDDPKTDFIIISGRDRNILDKWFKDLNVNLVAEHGAWIREKGKEWIMTKPLSSEWKPKLYQSVKLYADRLPNSFIEEKEFSLAWHYRSADPEQALTCVREMIDDITHFTANMEIQVLKGDKVVEIRNSGVNKGTAVMSVLFKNSYDFILAVGDDWTDEDVFKILPQETFTVKVGYKQSHAQYNVPNYLSVRTILKEIAL